MTGEEFRGAVFARLEDLGRVCEQNAEGKWLCDQVEVPLAVTVRVIEKIREVAGEMKAVAVEAFHVRIGDKKVCSGVQNARVAVEKTARAVLGTFAQLTERHGEKEANRKARRDAESVRERLAQAGIKSGVWDWYCSGWRQGETQHTNLSAVILFPSDLTDEQVAVAAGWLTAKRELMEKLQADLNTLLGLPREQYAEATK